MKNASQLVASLFVVSAFLVIHISAQASSVDLGFAPVVSRDITSEEAIGKGLLVQPDNKLVIWGGDFAIDGVAKGRISRLNVDGTVDNTFDYCGCLLVGISNVEVQTDGKLLVAGYGNGFQAKIVRLNQDGSQDNSFVSTITGITGFSSGTEIAKIQPDGKLLVDLRQGFGMGYHSGHLIRLNADGSTDGGFTWIGYDGGRLISGDITAVELDQVGHLYVSVTTYSGSGFGSTLKRYNSNGTLDNTWTTPNFSPSAGTRYDGLAVQADGSLLVAGRFDTVNGIAKRDIVRLFPAGNVDLDFSPPVLGASANQIKLLQSGKILVGYSLAGAGSIARLNASGILDKTFVLSPSVTSVSGKFVVDGVDRIIFLGISDRPSVRYFRLNPNGDRDLAFNPNVTVFGKVGSMALQSDGKILMAGGFGQINGIGRETIARVSSDGTLDASFDPGSGFSSPPQRVAIQADGKILAAGPFGSYNDIPRSTIARINPNGSLDTGFDPAIEGGSVAAIGIQSDGKILIAGSFTSVNGIPRTGVARLNADGSLDNAFNPIFGSPSLREIFQQPDGKVIVGGSFSGVNGFNRTGIVRLIASDGSLDQTFNAGTSVSVGRVWLQPDGKYVITSGATIFRRNSDGTPDASFTTSIVDTTDSSTETIDTVVTQPDGTLIVGGRFDIVSGRSRSNIVRLTSTGSVDLLFFPQGADGAVRASLRQPDGKVVVGGEFTKVQSVVRPGVARLNVAPFRAVTPFDFDGDGRADVSVVRPSTNRWYEVLSSTGAVYEETFGITGDVLAPADFDGDGITDEAIYRPASTNSQWWYRSSLNGGLVLNQFGGLNDIPRPADFDGDGKADLVLFRPADSTWYRFSSLTRQASSTPFGIPGDQPLVGDFDGDGKSDLAIFRPSNGDWWYAASSSGGAFRTVHWGQNGDIPVPADYDGDGKTDYAVYRPSEGGWYIYNSGNGSFTILAFGTNGDRPVAADYDGDGRADIAVFRPSTGIWYLLQSTSGFAGYQFGISTDTAIPGALIP